MKKVRDLDNISFFVFNVIFWFVFWFILSMLLILGVDTNDSYFYEYYSKYYYIILPFIYSVGTSIVSLIIRKINK